MMNNNNFVFNEMNTVFTSSYIMRNNNHDRGLAAQQHYIKPLRRRRRRLPTTKPYQEKFLNLAQARKEIAIALKLHKAATKEVSKQQKQQQQQQQQRSESKSFNKTGYEQQQEEFKQMILNSSTLLSHVNFFHSTSSPSPRLLPLVPNSCTFPFYSSISSSPPLLPLVPNSCTVPLHSPISPPLHHSHSPPALPSMVENFSYAIPDHTLGLNQNFHDFNYSDDILFLDNNISVNSPLFNYSSSSSSSSSMPLSAMVDQDVPLVVKEDYDVFSNSMVVEPMTKFEVGSRFSSNSMAASVGVTAKTQIGGGALHTAMDDEAMEEIRLVGEQYQKEWDDAVDLITSISWLEFLKNMENNGAWEEQNS
ncbi:uncharacterized protein [Arachis hypogaea]|uniref:Uncharacterized protein n=1 Tax=Arachis hypogaea TaxID=3818 RepID=A0A444YVI7_ARAHY|nr:putative uncharacterized protein DDB_G0291608 [Arachis hypogaea]XP_025607401.1 putative uncharacterized protein DDB_G0291608 [Arachis hypogaea]QHN87984.1 uncharacterized protein DS421_16g559820 [Arachis hypogaea]RYR05940.1 hypothetical protein Ahy_B06g085761 [Arachis hypogaea]